MFMVNKMLHKYQLRRNDLSELKFSENWVEIRVLWSCDRHLSETVSREDKFNICFPVSDVLGVKYCRYNI